MVEEFSESWLSQAMTLPVFLSRLLPDLQTTIPALLFRPEHGSGRGGWRMEDGHVDCTDVHDLARLCQAPPSLPRFPLHRGPGWAGSAQVLVYQHKPKIDKKWIHTQGAGLLGGLHLSWRGMPKHFKAED
jgi:hypothetical protein